MRPSLRIASASASARRGRSSVSMTSASRTASRALLVCRPPMRCRRSAGWAARSGGELGGGLLHAVLAEDCSWPAASAAATAGGGMGFGNRDQGDILGARGRRRCAAAAMRVAHAGEVGGDLGGGEFGHGREACRLGARGQVAAAARRHSAGRACRVLWLFTDARRLADPLAAVARLPPGLVRRGAAPRWRARGARAALGRALARLCRARRLALSVAGDWRLAAALGAGLHLGAGGGPGGAPRWLRAVTSSAHGVAELAAGAGGRAALAFLSPAFADREPSRRAGLGACRWGADRPAGRRRGGGAGRDRRPRVRRLPGCVGAGAIGALV